MTLTLTLPKSEEIFRKYGVTSLFGKKQIEEEKRVITEVMDDLTDIYVRLLVPLPISEEEDKMYTETIKRAIVKLREIL